MDTLPLSNGITVDSPVAGSPSAKVPEAPSINPMDVMQPSNDAEQTHRVKHELDVISNSPPVKQQVFQANVMRPTEETADDFEVDGDADADAEGDLDVEVLDYVEESDDPQSMDFVDISDYSGRSPFSALSNQSVENTPATRISDAFTASPSPGPSPHPQVQYYPQQHQQQESLVGMNPHGTYLSPHDQHFGEQEHQQYVPQPPTPESPQLFKCDQCDRTFDLYHKLKYVLLRPLVLPSP
jgi:hypothetical protein